MVELSSEERGPLKQPLPTLPAYPVLAQVLSYYGYEHQCRRLMMRLSKRTNAYLVSQHGELLPSFSAQAPPAKRPLFSFRMRPQPREKDASGASKGHQPRSQRLNYDQMVESLVNDQTYSFAQWPLEEDYAQYKIGGHDPIPHPVKIEIKKSMAGGPGLFGIKLTLSNGETSGETLVVSKVDQKQIEWRTLWEAEGSERLHSIAFKIYEPSLGHPAAQLISGVKLQVTSREDREPKLAFSEEFKLAGNWIETVVAPETGFSLVGFHCYIGLGIVISHIGLIMLPC